jgi:hypothetical protein
LLRLLKLVEVCLPKLLYLLAYQEYIDISVEQVAQLAQQNTLPEPTLDLSALSAPSTIEYPRQRAQTVYAADDPWHTSGFGGNEPGAPQSSAGTNGANPSSVTGSGLPKNWWNKQEKVTVKFVGQQGFILNRYMLYEISTDVRDIFDLSVTRLICWNTSAEHPFRDVILSLYFYGTV